MALDFAAGCLGGCAGLMVGYPLDTIKVHIQTQDHKNPRFKGTWHCFRSIIARESVTGLYRGMTSPMAGVAVVNAIVFGVYGQAQRNLSEPDHLMSHFLAGASAGLAQSPVCSPLELAKTRLQLQSTNGARYKGPMHCLRQVYRLEGHRGIFNGLGITAIREAPSYGVYFLTYELLTRSTPASEISTFQMLMSGGLAGTASWIVTYPIDVIKSRLQADSTGRYSGAIDCLKQSMTTEGYKWLFRGLNSTILRAFPTNAATFAVVTWTFRIFGDDQDYQKSSDKSNSLVEEKEEEKKIGRRHKIQQTREPQESFIDKCNSLVAKVMGEYSYQSRSYYSTGVTLINEDDVARRIDKSDNDLKYRRIESETEKNDSGINVSDESGTLSFSKLVTLINEDDVARRIDKSDNDLKYRRIESETEKNDSGINVNDESGTLSFSKLVTLINEDDVARRIDKSDNDLKYRRIESETEKNDSGINVNDESGTLSFSKIDDDAHKPNGTDEGG